MTAKPSARVVLDEMHDSSACVLCDLNLTPQEHHGMLVHFIQGAGWIRCTKRSLAAARKDRG